MLKIGITGGIGSGKTVVCQVFETLGIPVFYSDVAARYLMEHDKQLISALKNLFGKDVYANGILHREMIASIVFHNAGKLQQLNALVHPATIAYGKKWMQEQVSSYAIKEAAILFESGTNKDLDVIIGVYAPASLRMKRAMRRDQRSQEKIEAIMKRQMDEDEKMKRCDYVIVNDGQQAIILQVTELHRQLLQRNA